ncbi:MAG TPA: AAA family ATPase, partial [Gaiellaceae bacterium]|nr:AAA family ATPase [Gaiellaceae bacterium]
MAVDILGREEELASLLAFLDRARDGAGALVLEGQAGIGKSTLWLAGVEAARERSLRVLSTRPAEAERELGYAGLGDLLADVLEDALPALSTPRRRALEAALLLEDPVGGRADARAVAVAVQDALRALAEPAPVVVAVDDVQWLDASSAAALAFALRRLEASSVRVLLAHRAGTVRTPVEDALPGTERVAVGPLSVGAVQGLLKAHLDRAFPRPVLRRLHEVSGGNPFYALELGRALVREGVPAEPSAPLRVPETLERLVGDRLRALPEETGAALLVVAAVGAPGLGLLDALGVDPHALEAAVAAEVVEHADGEVRFTHPLLASAVYARASAAERRRVHARIAAVVAEPVAHASHLARSLDAPDAAAAARLEEAAALARDRGAPA